MRPMANFKKAHEKKSRTLAFKSSCDIPTTKNKPNAS